MNQAEDDGAGFDARSTFDAQNYVSRSTNSPGSTMQAASIIGPGSSTRKVQQMTVDWVQVLASLQREKKRAQARHEQQYVNRSLYCLPSSSSIREAFIKIVEWPWFNRLILILIVANCVFLVLEDPVCKCDADICSEFENYRRSLYASLDCSGWESLRITLLGAEYTFTILFTLEMVVKIVARGFILHKHAYLRDSWNWIDFVVVLASLISLRSSGGSIQVLRTIRVLRPLRTMTRIKGMQPLINTILRSFKNLGNVVSLLSFFFVVYGILGTDLLSAALRGRCYVDPTKNTFTEAAEARLLSQQIPYIAQPGAGDICSTEFADSWLGGRGCDPFVLDGVEYNTTCSRKKWCIDSWCETDWNDNPIDLGAGYFSYDNIGQAFLCIFQTLTNEGWIDFLYSFSDGWQAWGSRLFHSSWVLVGSFFVIQLALAVLADSFVEAQTDEKNKTEQEALHREAILRQVDRLPAVREDDVNTHTRMQRVSLRIKGVFSSVLESDITRSVATLSFTDTPHPMALKIREGWARLRSACRVMVNSAYFQNFIIGAILINTATMALVQHDQVLFEQEICQSRCDLDPSIPAEASGQCGGPLFNRTYYSDGQGGGMRPRQLAFCYLEDDAELEMEAGSVYEGSNCSLNTRKQECIEAAGVTGLGCHWFGDGGSDEKGKCKLGLYSADNFASAAPIGVDGLVQTISLRHLCGDGVDQCHDFSPQQDAILEGVNEVLTSIFIAEMILKWIGLGLEAYFADRFNQFDCLVVMSSILELIIEAASGGGGGSSSVSALRGMRLFRLFKLARSWKSMRQILHTLAVALGSMGPLAIVWVMFMYIFALLAMQFFGGRFKFVKTDAPRSNFDTFHPSSLGHGAFLIVFQIISTENYNTIMYNSITTQEPFNPWNSLLTISIVMFGNYIIMNLFISILLQGFGDGDDDDDNAELDEELSELTPRQLASLGPRRRPQPTGLMAKFKVLMWKKKPARVGGRTSGRGPASITQRLGGADLQWDVSQLAATGAEDAEEVQLSHLVEIKYLKKPVSIPAHNSFGFLGKRNPIRLACAAVAQHPAFENLILLCIFITTITLLLERPDDGTVAAACPSAPDFLNCSGLPPGQVVEINCAREETDETFGWVWDPCDAKDSDRIPACCEVASRVRVFTSMDTVFTIIFLIEMILKMVSDGFIFHEQAYFRSAWNWLDFFIVVVSMISSFGDTSSLKSLKALRAVRALRPLRVIKRNPGLKIAVVCLLSSIPALMNVMVVVLLWFSMYAMLGVQIFKGGLYSCYDLQNQVYYGTAFAQRGPTYTPTPNLSGPGAVPTIIECVNAGNIGGLGSWEDKPYTFNDYPRALLTLFEMSTTEGWMDVMAASVDRVSVGITPLPNFRPWYALYSVLHIVLGAFVLLNLIVGSVINNYNRIKTENEGRGAFITEEQQEWREMQKLIFKLKPKKRQHGPENPVRQILFKISNHPYFEYLITLVIVMNVASMALKHYDQTDCFSAALFWANVGFGAVFVIEAIIKIIGLGPQWYFRDAWNVFDFSVVLLGLATTVLDVINKAYDCGPNKDEEEFNVPGLQILRVFRICRVFRLVRRLKGLKQMIETLIISLPSLGNIAALIVLIIVIFAVLGNTFFYNVNQEQDFYGRMDDHANYFHLDNALWALHRQTTGEAWNEIMYYCANDDQYRACDKCYGEYLGDGCGGAFTGIVYHVLWQLFGTYVMMQLFTAVILENFHDLAQGDLSSMPVDKLGEFVDVWTTLDPDAAERISVDKLPELIRELSPPLGLKNKLVTANSLMQVIKDLAIPIRGKASDTHVTYRETFISCVKRVLAHEVEDDPEDLGSGVLLQQAVPEDSELPPGAVEDGVVDNNDTPRPPMFRGRPITAAEDFAARAVQKAYREWREKKIQVMKAINWSKSIPVNAREHDLVAR